MIITLIICIAVIVVVSIICYMNYKIQTTSNGNLREIFRKINDIEANVSYLDNVLDSQYYKIKDIYNLLITKEDGGE